MYSSNNNKQVFGSPASTSPFSFGTNITTNQTPFVYSAANFGTTTPGFGSTPQQSGAGLFSNTAGTSHCGFAGSNLFGQQQNATGGNPQFGSSAFSQEKKPFGFGVAATASSFGQTGSVIKFNPIVVPDTVTQKGIARTINTKINCISCMKEYEATSLEELRWEDYQCNRKGPQQQTTPEVLKFGSQAVNRLSPFGQSQNTPAFGQTENKSVGIFGQTQNKGLFGQSSTSEPTNQSNQLFSFGKQFAATPTTTTFSFTPTSAAAFGDSAGAKPFGTLPIQNTFTTPTPISQPNVFGRPAFGQTNTQDKNSFFNKSAQPVFNFSQLQQTTTQSSLLQPSKSITFPCFGKTEAATSLSSFGKIDSVTNLPSVSQVNAPANFNFGLQPNMVPQPTQTPVGAFQNPVQKTAEQSPLQFTFGTQMRPGANMEEKNPMFQGAAQNMYQPPNYGYMMPQQYSEQEPDFYTIVNKVYETFPPQKLFENIQSKTFMDSGTTNPMVLKKLIEQESMPIIPSDDNVKLKLLTAPKERSYVDPVKLNFLKNNSELRTDYSSIMQTKVSRKSLLLSKEKQEYYEQLKQKWLNSVPDIISQKFKDDFNIDEIYEDDINIENHEPRNAAIEDAAPDVIVYDQNQKSKPRSPLTVQTGGLFSFLTKRLYKDADYSSERTEEVRKDNEQFGSSEKSMSKSSVTEGRQSPTSTYEAKNLSDSSKTDDADLQEESPKPVITKSSIKSLIIKNTQALKNKGDFLYNMVGNLKILDDVNERTELENKDPSQEIDQCGIKLTRKDYYTIPPLDEIHRYKNEKGECLIKGFTVGRHGFGHIYYPEEMDVFNLDLDEIVHFHYRAAVIYPDDNKKPPVGQGLNRPAQITLDGVWPRHRVTHEVLKDPKEIKTEKFIEKLIELNRKQDAAFVYYRPTTGSWVFDVEHLSKFSFHESDDEDEETPEKTTAAKREQEPKKQEMEQKGQKEQKPPRIGLGGNSLDEAGDIIMQKITPSQTFSETKLPSVREDTSSRMIKHLFYDEAALTQKEMEIKDHKKKEPCQIGLDNNILYEMGDFTVPKMTLHQTLSQAKLASVCGEDTNIMMMKYAFLSEELIYDLPNNNFKIIQNSFIPTSSSRKISQLQKRTVTCKPKYDVLINRSLVVPIQKSLLTLSSHSYMDAALFKGKSFKVGCGPGFTFMTIGTAFTSGLDPSVINEGCMDYAPNAVMHLQVGDLSKNTQVIYWENHLEAVFEESAVILDDSQVPLFTINENYQSLLCHQRIAESVEKDNSIDISHYQEIWNLCLAFWGPDATTPTNRRELFSKWLKDVTVPFVKNELTLNTIQSSNIIKNIFIYLTGHKINEAAELAEKAGLPNLSVLISQSSAQESSKLLMNNQLEHWNNTGVINTIDETIIKTYMLLGGIPFIYGINVSEDLDWKRALAVYFWYMYPAGTSLVHAVQAYQRAFMSDCATPPNSEGYECSNVKVYNVLYQIMMLFVTPTMPLEKVVNPITYTDDPLDYQMSWLLLQVFTALKIGTVSQQVADSVHVSFSSQLEYLGLWKWSIFVLLFIKDKNFKTNAVMSVLDRNLSPDRNNNNTSVEDFLVNNFKIPSEWIHTVLANKTNLLQNHVETYKHLILAKNWCKAHEIAITLLIPEFMSTGQCEKLFDLIKLLIPGKGNILQWNAEAGLVSDFLQLHQKITINIEFMEMDLNNLKCDLTDLCFRLRDFPIASLKQTVTITELSRFIAVLLKIVFCELRSGNAENVQRVVELVDMLIMPPDYKRDELEKYVYRYLKIE